MQLTPVFLESLLHHDEGPTLDFKRDQYAFGKGSTPDRKELLRSKLVKDILAFANTEREISAFVLIGVEEVKGGRSKVIGVKDHLDDENLHDFMKRRTQRPVEFSYRKFPIDDVEIGVIEIPVQDRLQYLAQDYGEVRGNVVYLRDGSTTRTATPEEIIEMSTAKRPELTLSWADSEGNVALPSPIAVKTLLLYPPLPLGTFNFPSPPVQRGYGVEIAAIFHSHPNLDYSRDLIVYASFKALFIPLGLQLHNESGVSARRVRFEGTMNKQKGLAVRDVSPSFPKKEIGLFADFSNIDVLPLSHEHQARLELVEDSERWMISVEFGDIRPGESVTTIETLWFGSYESGIVSLNGKLLGDNISEPISCSLGIQFESGFRPMTVDDVDLYKRAHFEFTRFDER